MLSGGREFHQASVMINSIAAISGKPPQPIMPPANGIPRFTRSRLCRQVPAAAPPPPDSWI